MKKVLLICSIIWSLLFIGRAQDVVIVDGLESLEVLDTLDTMQLSLITEQMQYAVVHQDSLIDQLMRDKRTGYVRGEQIVDGFRLQIYASNRQQVAKKEAAELQQLMESQIDVPVYTISEPPFWKVRLGNFSTREEANDYKTIFLQLYPEMVGSTYVVPDKIIVLNN